MSRSCVIVHFFLMVRVAAYRTLFPYTTLFRSSPLAFAPGRGGETRRLLRQWKGQMCKQMEMTGPAPARQLRPFHGDSTSLCRDRKSTRLNSSHMSISYAVFCLKKKTTPPTHNS